MPRSPEEPTAPARQSDCNAEAPSTPDKVCTGACTTRAALSQVTRPTRTTKPNRLGCAGSDGRYWARTKPPVQQGSRTRACALRTIHPDAGSGVLRTFLSLGASARVRVHVRHCQLRFRWMGRTIRPPAPSCRVSRSHSPLRYWSTHSRGAYTRRLPGYRMFGKAPLRHHSRSVDSAIQSSGARSSISSRVILMSLPLSTGMTPRSRGGATPNGPATLWSTRP